MKYRYPGIQSFTSADQSLFFGRDQEVKELFRLVVMNSLSIVFGKSGIGKTSLLQAGISPMLQQKLLYPVKIRLNNFQQLISRQIYEQLNEAKLLPENIHEELGREELSLWEYCKQCRYVSSGRIYTPVLIFDQFEELFTLYQQNIDNQQRFITQLADVINQVAPEHLLGSARNNEEREYFARPPKVHIIISIRSDYLYLLDRLSDLIPSILRVRYELKALDGHNARLAITEPARLAQIPPPDRYGTPSIPFIAPPFRYNAATLDDIIDALTLNSTLVDSSQNAFKQNEVGAFQLQLLCRSIEDKIITEHCGENFEVTPSFYGGKAGIVSILAAFYSNVLAKFSLTTQTKVQHLIEEKLLSDGRRILQEKGSLKRECKVSDEDLTILTKERLIKEEPRGDSLYYEISHDILIRPIIDARDERLQKELLERQKEELIAKERRAQDAEAKVKEEEEKRIEAERLKQKAEQASKRARRLAFIAFTVAFIAVFLMLRVILLGDKLEKTIKNLENTIGQRDSLEYDKVKSEVTRINNRADELEERHPEIAKKIRTEGITKMDEYRRSKKVQEKRDN